MKDYYEILEVHPKASQEVIKKAYQTLAKQYHPDVTVYEKGFDHEKLTEINEAYSVLSDQDSRGEYDKQFFADTSHKTGNALALSPREGERMSDELDEENTEAEKFRYGVLFDVLKKIGFILLLVFVVALVKFATSNVPAPNSPQDERKLNNVPQNVNTNKKDNSQNQVSKNNTSEQKPTQKYMDEGNRYFNNEQYANAIESFALAIKLDPKYSEAYYKRGSAYMYLGEIERALADLKKAIELNPNNGQAYCVRGAIYVIIGENTKAIADYTKAIEIDPKNIMAYGGRGGAYGRVNDYEHAIADLTKVIELDSQNATAYCIRGWCYGRLGDDKRAINEFQKAIEINPEFGQAYHWRGVVYQRLGNTDKANADFAMAKKYGYEP